jgi:hypothetical protein
VADDRRLVELERVEDVLDQRAGMLTHVTPSIPNRVGEPVTGVVLPRVTGGRRAQ